MGIIKLLQEQCLSILNVLVQICLIPFRRFLRSPTVVLDEPVEGSISVTSENQVKIFGIWGMGGSGKTTLAKEFFNRNFSSFDRNSFLANVRDAADLRALLDKQKKLLEDLGVNHLPFDSVDEGMAILANRLSSVQALIVLDDVDHFDQLRALLPSKDNLGSKSIVIITTRELGVLLKCGVTCIYEMRGLNRGFARQLFCWQTFLQPSPSADLKDLAEAFLNVCPELPLLLKVLGAHLYGKGSKDYWLYQINKIRRVFPDDIKSILKISYDALDEKEQEMFLDVACFLSGETESTAVAVWDGMNFSGLRCLQTLVNKCLVEMVPNFSNDENIFNEKEIRMHDHLRDMGREIASRHSSYRLWWPGQIHNMMNNFKKERQIRGIRPAATFQAFKEYKQELLGSSNGLKLLHVERNEFTEEFASLSKDLVCLQWTRFPHRNLPSWLTLGHLSVLELYDADLLEELWEDNVDPPSQLRKLSISGSFQGLERLPTSIGRLQYLKMISIPFEGSSLPKEFCCLLSLEYLHLRCARLRSLPDGFGNLLNMKFIYLEDCRELGTLPDSFEQLIHLKDLDISKSMFSTLPDGFGNLTSLRRINLDFCSNLGRLPDSFDQLIRLESLNLLSCGKLSSLPAGFGNLVNLKHIDMKNCTELSTLPDSFKHLIQLELLNLSYCGKLKLKLDAFENIRKLKILVLEGCKELEDLPNEIETQTSLTELNIRGCIKLRASPTNIGQLFNLPSLKIITSESDLKKINA